MNDYEALKRHGHSPAKALEIVLDAKRGDQHAIAWINVTRESLLTESSTTAGFR